VREEPHTAENRRAKRPVELAQRVIRAAGRLGAGPATEARNGIERGAMLEEDQVRELADHWVKAWNSHDLDRIMAHYADDVVLISPVAAKILGDPSGRVTGKAALRAYFKRALDVYPNLSFELVDLMWGLESVVLYYVNQKGSKTGEYMEIGPTGKVSKVVANYSG
jgi:hypothetical protein